MNSARSRRSGPNKVLALLLLSVAFLGGCAKTTYWIKDGGTQDEFDRLQAACHNKAFFVPKVEYQRPDSGYIASTTVYPYANTSQTVITPYRAPYQNMADALGSLAANFENIARREKFMENCMAENGWKMAQKRDLAMTVPTYALVGDAATSYEGTATGYIDRTGTMKVKSASGDICVGSFRYTSPHGGTGIIRCDSGDSAAIEFKGLSNSSGYGSGTTASGEIIRFTYGLNEDERKKYLQEIE